MDYDVIEVEAENYQEFVAVMRRYDWLVRNFASVKGHTPNDTPIWQIHTPIMAAMAALTIDEAIDKAMKETGK